MSDADLKLGLIGDNIARSRSPLLHQLAGQQNGIRVQYDRLIPKDMKQTFDGVFDDCAADGYAGINITYPYKELAAKKVRIDDPLVRAIGAVNTVLFTAEGPKGQNTDYSGFLSAYRSVRGEANPGIVCLVGTGGVGRALAFALIKLGATEIRLVDIDEAKANALASELSAIDSSPKIVTFAHVDDAAAGANGFLNGTPVGMIGHEGTPISKDLMIGAEWAFDAVYTPIETEFLRDAEALGLSVISGYELFFFQGVHAWHHFSGRPLDEDQLRAEMLEQEEAA